MLEYALSKHMDDLISDTFSSNLYLTFFVAHKYTDFFVQDTILEKYVQIEMKTVDVDSDEQSTRFEVLSTFINAQEDVVFLVGWAWWNNIFDNGTNCECSEIFSYVVVPAIELARGRTEYNLKLG